MNIYKTIFLFSILLSCSISVYGQEHDHDHPRNEIGLSYGASYSINHKEWGSGIHIHYFRTLSDHSKWSLGGGVEQVWSDGSHYNISAGFKYQIIDRMTIGLLPGLTFLKHDDEHEESSGYKSQFAMHTELVYELFHFGKFHLGPAIDYAWTKNDQHFMLGVHFAYGF